MASTFLDSFLPSLTGELGKTGGALGQGLESAQKLALLQMQLQQQQQELSQQKQLFPLQLQLQRQSLPLELQKLQTELGYKQALSKQAEAMAKMYGGGLYPAGSITEYMKRLLAADPTNPQALLFQDTMARAKGLQAGVEPLDDQTLQSMAALANRDSGYHPNFSGPWGPLNQQKFNQYRMGVTGAPGGTVQTQVEGQTVAPPSQKLAAPSPTPTERAEGIYGAQTEAKGQRKALMGFMPGGKEATTLRSFNVIIHHGNTMLRLIKELDATGIPFVNQWKNFLQTGVGDPRVVQFNAARKIFTDEITKAIIGGQAAMSDREANAESLVAKGSPEQMTGAITTLMEMAAGQLSGLRTQYEQSTGRKDFDRYLQPEAKQRLQPQTPASSPILEKSPVYQQTRPLPSVTLRTKPNPADPIGAFNRADQELRQLHPEWDDATIFNVLQSQGF